VRHFLVIGVESAFLGEASVIFCQTFELLGFPPDVAQSGVSGTRNFDASKTS
jgi:hypothetical protein